MNKIFSALDWITGVLPALWKSKVPKPVRFFMFWTSSPVWFPILLVCTIAICIVGNIIEIVVDEYHSFDN